MPFKVLVVTHAILVLGFLTGHGASVVTRDWCSLTRRCVMCECEQTTVTSQLLMSEISM